MTTPTLLRAATIGLLAFLPACGDRAQPGGPGSVQASEAKAPTPSLPSVEKLGQDATAALESAKETLAAKQKEFSKASEARLAALDQRIAELRARIETAGAETRPELEKLGDELAARRAAAATKLVEWKVQSSEAWTAFTKEVDHSMNELDHALDAALSKTK